MMVSEFIAMQCFPSQDEILGAFTTEGRPLREDCDPWRLPRFVCGWHWKTNDELRALLAAA